MEEVFLIRIIWLLIAILKQRPLAMSMSGEGLAIYQFNQFLVILH